MAAVTRRRTAFEAQQTRFCTTLLFHAGGNRGQSFILDEVEGERIDGEHAEGVAD